MNSRSIIASMRAAGDVKFAMIVLIASMWVFRIGAAYLLANGLRMGAVEVWAAMAVDWLFRAVVFIPFWKMDSTILILHTVTWAAKARQLCGSAL